jgi:PadR family transcriptional regulator, regulatory protein AphA
VSLRYAILGYLTSAPGTGYDLAQQFDSGLGWFWGALHSQIYPELRRLTEEELIIRTPEAAGPNLNKFTYSITDKGREELKKWTAQPPTYPPNRDSERLQLIFSDEAPESLRAHFETHISHFEKRRERLTQTLSAMQAGQHERINLRVAQRAPEDAEITLKLRDLAYTGDIARADLEIEWARRGLAWLDSRKESTETKREESA